MLLKILIILLNPKLKPKNNNLYLFLITQMLFTLKKSLKLKDIKKLKVLKKV